MRRRTLATLALAALTTAGCQGPGPLGHDEGKVAADKHATAAEVIEAGHPVDVAVAGDRTMVLYGAYPTEDDEGPHQHAWRLYDAGGERVADGSLGQSEGVGAGLDGFGNGFLVHSDHEPALLFVDPAGKQTTVRSHAEVRPTRPGDLSVWAIDGPQAFYRPAEQATYRLHPLPRMVQAVAIDERGTVWAQVPLHEFGVDRGKSLVVHAARGTGPWRREIVAFGAKTKADYDLVVAGSRVLFSTYTGNPDRKQPAAVLGRRPDGLWTETPLTGVPKAPATIHLAVSPRGRILYSNNETWLQQPDRWKRLDLPEYAEVSVQGDRIFAVTGDAVSVSDDEGASWQELDR